MSHGHRHHNFTVEGIVCPTGWSAWGEVEGVSIMTWDEDEYEVSLEGVGRDLIEYLHRAVAVRGQILPDFRRRKVIRVKRFSILNRRDAVMNCLDSS